MAWPVRKILGFAGVSLHLTQTKAPPPEDAAGAPVTTIRARQTVTPGGFNSEDSYILDSKDRVSNVPIFGTVAVRTTYVPVAELEDAELRKRVESGGGDVVIQEVVENKKAGWKTDGTWAFEAVEGERRFTRTSVTTTSAESDVQVIAKVVYDFKAEK